MGGGGGVHRTLQKSMLFTPLLPSAGPTGGEGDACPAPTISLTIWSFAIAFLAMMGLGCAELVMLGYGNFCGELGGDGHLTYS
jgi:hypothetical protein